MIQLFVRWNVPTVEACLRDDEQAAQELISNDILVEPYLGDGISSPRRRIWVYHCDEADALERHHTPYHPAMTARCSRKEELPAAEPLLIGEFPVATALASASCIIEPVATFRLGEKLGDVRQRLLFDEEQRQRSTNAFHTMAMALYPNPSSPLAEPDPATTQGAPRLRLDAARLIAAAMRAVLPSIYRGASFSIEVALHLDSRNPSSDQELASHEGFYFYDPQPGGTGAARALHRDGPELLLRLCRVYIERVLYHDRLRARYEDEGIDVAVYQSVRAVSPTSPLDFDQRVQAVQAFRRLPEAEALAAANKRVSNILSKADGSVSEQINTALLQEAAEQALANAVAAAEQAVAPLASQRQYTATLEQLAALRAPVDAFFEQVLVNAEDDAVKANRYALLARLRGLFLGVADISLLG